jgi:hypothetical protein
MPVGHFRQLWRMDCHPFKTRHGARRGGVKGGELSVWKVKPTERYHMHVNAW